MDSDKTSTKYIIAKLLLNSLYGRMGMSPYKEHPEIISNKEALNLIYKFEVSNIIDFKNGKELVSFFDHSGNDNLNISVAISLAVTAMARVHMSQFKTMKDITLYYSDTDSIDIDKPLPNNLIRSYIKSH
jgi:DNA polymerase type B, organellar and viral